MALPNMTDLLGWSTDPNRAPMDDKAKQELRNLMFGTGPSNAEQMKMAMACIQDLADIRDNKEIAFGNLHDLVEQVDNANNLEPLKLWQPLVDLLEHEEDYVREKAAWCMGAAVENNVKSQERMLVIGAIPALVKQAIEDSSKTARKTAIMALSKGARNYQPSVDTMVEKLPADYGVNKVDAGDMDAIDQIRDRLLEESAKKG